MNTLTLKYKSVRTVTSQEDKEAGRQVLTGYLPAESVLDIPLDENVRGFLPDGEGRERKSYTSVHKAIMDTIRNHPARFHILNSGVTLVSRKIEIDNDAKTVKLSGVSLINGAQTQGVIKDAKDEEVAIDGLLVRFELVVTEDEELIAETSISRNTQNSVKSISIIGRRGILDELNRRFKKSHPDLQLQTSETETPSEESQYVATEKLLQVVFSLLPEELWFKGDTNRTYSYNSRATCLKDFVHIHQAAHDENDPDYVKMKDVYGFFLDIAAQAHDLYAKWKRSKRFQQLGLKISGRDSDKPDNPDGIVFPIISAMTEFARKTQDGWKLRIPRIDDDLAEAAVISLREIARGRPELMGKSKSAWTNVRTVAAMFKKFAPLKKQEEKIGEAAED